MSQPPKVLSLAPLLVDAPGATATITKAVLHLEDPDNAAEVLLVVLEPPQHGRIALLHGNGELGRFSLEQLSRGQVVYLHDGSPGHTDLFMLQVNDQHNYLNVPIQVLISPTVGPGHSTCRPSISPVFISVCSGQTRPNQQRRNTHAHTQTLMLTHRQMHAHTL